MLPLILCAALAAPDQSVAILVSETGVDGAALSGTPTTNAINMEAGKVTPQLSLSLAVTPGTTTTVDVRCYESQDKVTWDQIALCDSATPKSACAPDVRSYTLANFTGTVKTIASRWEITKKFAKCSADDPSDGTGTVVITGARSAP